MQESICPMCGLNPGLGFKIKDENDYEVMWKYCKCGTVYHDEKLDYSSFNEDYRIACQKGKDSRERYDYLVRVYAPLIEELTYGRRFLDVGYTLPWMIDDMRERGWVVDGIDLIPGEHRKGDFLTEKFDQQFDLIHLGRVVESFSDTKKGLYKSADLLKPQGILLVRTTAPQLINDLGLSIFGGWQWKEKRVFVSPKEMIDFMKICGLRVVMFWENMNKRFMNWNDNHFIFQKVRK